MRLTWVAAALAGATGTAVGAGAAVRTGNAEISGACERACATGAAGGAAIGAGRCRLARSGLPSDMRRVGVCACPEAPMAVIFYDNKILDPPSLAPCIQTASRLYPVGTRIQLYFTVSEHSDTVSAM